MVSRIDTETERKPHPEVARLRRTVGVSVTLHRALVWAVLSAVFAAVFVGRWPVWAVAGVIAVAAVIAFVSVHGSVISERIAARYRYFQRRRRGYGQLPGRIVDIDGCGVRCGDGYELVTAIELTADLAETRLREGRAYAADTVPLDLLASMMTQYGLNVDIDVASVGRRVPPGPAYRASYAQGVRFYAAMAQRSTWLILRLNTHRNLAGIVRRGPSRTAGPKALMAATRRLEQRLQERQIRARVLPASELAPLASQLSFGADTQQCGEHWGYVSYGNSFTTTYFVDPGRMSTEKLDRWWGQDTDGTAVVLRLRKPSQHGAVAISGLVRYDTATPQIDNHDDSLVLLSGRQRELALATMPGGASSVVDLPAAPLSELADVQIPVGPAGPVWGIAGPNAIALPLFDASPVPETLQVEFATDLTVAQLILLRSVGAGASVAVHTVRPERWVMLANTLADQGRFRIVGPGDRRPADLTVFDGVEVYAVPERTLLTVREPGGERNAKADVTVEQVTMSKVVVRIGRREPIEVVLNPPDEELRYCDVVVPPKAAVAGEIPPGQRIPRQAPTLPRYAPAASPQVGPAPLAPPAALAPPMPQSGPMRRPVAPTPPPGPLVPPAAVPQPPRPRRPLRPAPPPPFERGSGAQRKTDAGRWVRGGRHLGPEGSPSRRPRQEPGAPRWTNPKDEPPPPPPTSP